MRKTVNFATSQTFPCKVNAPFSLFCHIFCQGVYANTVSSTLNIQDELRDRVYLLEISVQFGAVTEIYHYF